MSPASSIWTNANFGFSRSSTDTATTASTSESVTHASSDLVLGNAMYVSWVVRIDTMRLVLPLVRRRTLDFPILGTLSTLRWTGSSPQEVSNAPVRGFPCYWSPPYNLALVAGGYVMKPIRESCRWLLIAVLVLFAPALTEAHEASVTAVIENPAQYDGQTVT